MVKHRNKRLGMGIGHVLYSDIDSIGTVKDKKDAHIVIVRNRRRIYVLKNSSDFLIAINEYANRAGLSFEEEFSMSMKDALVLELSTHRKKEKSRILKQFYTPVLFTKYQRDTKNLYQEYSR